MALTPSRLRKALEVMDEAELRELIEILYRASTDNKRLLAAQLEGNNSELLEVYIKALQKCFDPKKSELKVAPARKALQNYLRVASPLEALQAKIRYVRTALAYWDEVAYWTEQHDTALGNMFEEIAHGTLQYTEHQDLLESVHKLGQEFIAQEKKYGYFDWQVEIYKSFKDDLGADS
jgi:hypothetical protein